MRGPSTTFDGNWIGSSGGCAIMVDGLVLERSPRHRDSDELIALAAKTLGNPTRIDRHLEGLRCRTLRGEVRGSISALPHFPRIMEEHAAGLAEKFRFCRTAGHSAMPQPRVDSSCIKLARLVETANRYPRMSASLLSRLRDRTVRRPGPACVPAG